MKTELNSRSGVALILVLGMVAVIMILAVAFAISMRTEATAAGHYIEVAKARQLVHSALAFAMADIEYDLINTWGTPSYPSQWTIAPVGNQNQALNLYEGEVIQLIPPGMLEAAGKLPSPGKGTAATDGNNNVSGGGGTETFPQDAPPEEVLYRYTTNAIPLWREVGDGKGRIAYMVVNLSGLLDGHYVGGTEREYGVSVAEMDISMLPEMTGDGSAFVDNRSAPDDPYETLFELSGEAGITAPSALANLGIYSRSPAAMNRNRDGDYVDPVALDADEATLTEALELSMWHGAADAEKDFPWDKAAEVVYRNKLDYEDEDSVPQVVDGPSVEKIPMINEIWSEYVVANTNPLAGQILVWVECAYPFLTVSDEEFKLHSDVKLVATNFTAMPAPITADFSNPDPSDPFPVRPVAIFNLAGAMHEDGISYTVEISDMEMRLGGTPVDRVPSPLMLPPVPPTIPVLNTMTFGSGKDVIDPVFNWHAMHWELTAMPGSVYSYTNTKNAINYSTEQYLNANADVSDIEPASVAYLHVANEPMKTVGELGYLYSPGPFAGEGVDLGGFPTLIGKVSPVFDDAWTGPRLWRTARLYDHGPANAPSGYRASWSRVLDHIATNLDDMRPMGGGENVFVGRMNPNSELVPAQQAAWTGVPMTELPGDNSDPLTGFALSELVAAIQTHTITNPLARLSDFGRRELSSAMFGALGIQGDSELKKESLFRNNAGLFHSRQNLFAIILAGQTAADPSYWGAPDGMPRSDQRALAIVWRDPVPDDEGRHRSFVRWFTWLER